VKSVDGAGYAFDGYGVRLIVVIVTRSGKLNERATGGFVIPVVVYVPMVLGNAGCAASGHTNLFDVANMCLPTDAEVNIFASAAGRLQ
jgi:hypothetical protein